MDVRLFVEQAAQKLRRAGLRAALREGFDLLRDGRITDEFDLKYGTDTGGLEPLWRFKINSPNARFVTTYQTLDEQRLIDAVSFLDQDPRHLTFVDVGCGKGRPLLVAAKLGFKEIIGVEFVRELAEIAKKNLQKVGVVNAVVVQADAAEYRFPKTDMVVYLFNPFSQKVMRQVIANLRESLAGKLYVIYAAPRCAALFDARGFLTRLGCPPGRTGIQIWRSAR